MLNLTRGSAKHYQQSLKLEDNQCGQVEQSPRLFNRILKERLPFASGAGKGKGRPAASDAALFTSCPNERHRQKAMHAPNDRGIAASLAPPL